METGWLEVLQEESIRAITGILIKHISGVMGGWNKTKAVANGRLWHYCISLFQGLFYNSFIIADYAALNTWMIDDLRMERIWKEKVMS